MPDGGRRTEPLTEESCVAGVGLFPGHRRGGPGHGGPAAGASGSAGKVQRPPVSAYRGVYLVRAPVACVRSETGMRTHRYQITINGGLGEAGREAFADFGIESDGANIVLTGDMDQSALHGALARIQALGLDLAEVRRLADT